LEFAGSNGRSAALPYDDRRRMIGQCDSRRGIAARGARERKRRDYGVAGAAHVEHFLRFGLDHQRLASVAIEERDPTRAQRQQHARLELPAHTSADAPDVLVGRRHVTFPQQPERLAPVRRQIVALGIEARVLRPRIDHDLLSSRV
jgi:hypothetical protein